MEWKGYENEVTRQRIFDKFIEFMGKFAELKVVVALRDGFIMTTPFTICGSAFLLIANLPIPGYAQFMASIFGSNWTDPLNQVAGATFSVLALICVLTISYKYCEAEGCDAMMGAVMAMSTFLILTASYIVSKSGEKIGDVIPKMWAGSNGIITAIIVSFAVSYIFCYCEKNKIGIKMPESVPTGVVKAFSALVPGLIFFTGAAVIYTLCKVLAGVTFPELIFKILQTPLQNISDTLLGGSVIAGLQSILFWAGIHGPNVVGGVISPVLTANAIDNQHLLDAGMQLLGNPQAKIITIQVNDVFIKSGGCGLTLGFLIASFLCARSQQLKSISKLSFVPGLFNINEPIIFGLPIVFNPYLLVPFVIVPIIAMIITYSSIVLGFMSPFSAVQVPWTTPAIISGALLNGWQGVIVQIVNLIMATILYFPFVKLQDRVYLKEETVNKTAG
ncbi:PTS transporter subunit EIIC [Pectinatus frisingensis]|jgi:PTS system cellobiose-specific IIC component|uniref:PTS sugar transporter subunit IIC n=1 Tax=Pectinatus frisingensis TaxID=865 RepID=UPI001E338422|nr:PTS transporter subunit EIIC [Pectinatus frisingensis]